MLGTTAANKEPDSLLILSVPVIGIVLIQNGSPMRLNAVSVRVHPDLSGPNGRVFFHNMDPLCFLCSAPVVKITPVQKPTLQYDLIVL